MLKQRRTWNITCSNCYHVWAQVNKVQSHFIQSARDNIAESYDLLCFESDAEHLEFIYSLLADKEYIFPVAEHVEGGVLSPSPTLRESKAANESRASTPLHGRRNRGVEQNQILSSGE